MRLTFSTTLAALPGIVSQLKIAPRIEAIPRQNYGIVPATPANTRSASG
jgi:hypothetical protein